MGIVEWGTAFFTAAAAVAAAWSAWISRSQFKNQTDRQKEQERPRLVPLNEDVYLNKSEDFVDMHLAYDWKLSPHDKHTYTKKSDFFSGFSFPIVNAGKSLAVKVDITYFLENGIDAVEEIENETVALIITDPKLKQLETDVFSFDLKEYKNFSPKGDSIDNNFVVTPSNFRVSIIKSGETEQIRLPFYFVVLNNLYLDKHQKAKPKLRLNIEYEDEYHEKHRDSYRVELLKHKPNPNFDREDYWLDFTKIKPNDKKAAQPSGS